MLRGVKFGDYHTAMDWGLILNNVSLNPPEPKTVYVSVDGRDGDLDLSEALTGEIKYGNRVASFTFLLTEGSYLDRENLITEIMRIVHGKKLQIILDDDTGYYLYGRCSVKSVNNDKSYGSVVVECNCEPWRYAILETIRVVTVDVGLKSEIACMNNGAKTVIPEITITGGITITFGESTATLADGTYKLTNLLLKPGATVITVEGSGTMTMKYREAIL